MLPLYLLLPCLLYPGSSISRDRWKKLFLSRDPSNIGKMAATLVATGTSKTGPATGRVSFYFPSFSVAVVGQISIPIFPPASFFSAFFFTFHLLFRLSPSPLLAPAPPLLRRLRFSLNGEQRTTNETWKTGKIHAIDGVYCFASFWITFRG